MELDLKLLQSVDNIQIETNETGKTEKVRPSTPPTPPEALKISRLEDSNYTSIQHGKWSSEFFFCFQSIIPNCLLSTFCLPIPLAQLYHRMGLLTYKLSLLCFSVFYGVTIVGALYFLLHHCLHLKFKKRDIIVLIWFLSGFFALSFSILFIRIKIRKVFEIYGSSLMDCLGTTFCSCCSVAQMTTHTKVYTSGTCSCSAPYRLRDISNVV